MNHNFFLRFLLASSVLYVLVFSATPVPAEALGNSQGSETTESEEPQENQQTAAEAQPSSAPRQVTVGLFVSRPFVMEDGDGNFTGMAFELWEEAAENLNLESDYVVLPTFRALVDSTEAGAIDVAVSNLTINRSRIARVDFTHSWFDSGLQIMTAEGQPAGFRGIIGGLRSSGYLHTYGLIGLAIVLCSLLITLFYRRFDSEFPNRWQEGIAEGFYTVMSLLTSGKTGRKNLFGWIGRIWQGVWLVCGVAVLAYVTSTVTSVMTTISLTNQINSVDDLSGRSIGVRDGSDAEEVARGMGLRVQAYANTDEIADALLGGEVEAMVGDSPVLKYYVLTNPDLPLQVVGNIFKKDKYGFVLPYSSDLTRPLSVELVGARRQGRTAELREKYFGDEI